MTTAVAHAASPTTECSTIVDPITLEVLRHRLWMINDEQGKVAIQISGSPTVYESKDLNSSIMTPEGDSLFVGVYTTRVALCLDVAAKHIIAHFSDNPGIRDGDAFITNDPWTGAGHQNDFMVLAPIFWQDDVVAWTGIAMHDVDVGGPVPGNFTVGAKNVFDEAPLVPPLRIVERGVVRRDVEALVLRNSRTPELNALNLRARLAAVSRTRERIQDMIREYGKETFLETQRRLMQLVRKAFVRRLSDFPDGSWRAEGYLDHDGNNNELYPIRLGLTKMDDRLIFDYTGTSPQVEGPVNCTWVGMQCGVVSAVLSTLCYDMPWSPGALMDLLEIRAPDGLINRATYPAAVGIATISGVYATQQVAHCAIVKMLAAARSRKHRLEAQANWTSSAQVTGVTGRGVGDQWFAAMLMDRTGGAGACLSSDGLDTGGIPGSPSQAIANVETYERQYPLLYVYRKQCRDTGGAGRSRGGVGTELMFIPHRNTTPLTFTVVGHGASQPEAHGLFGGCPGSIQPSLLLQGTGVAAQFAGGFLPSSLNEIDCRQVKLLEAKDRDVLNSGDALLTISSGGGGYGDPLLRPPQAVHRDYLLGISSPATVRDIYGIVIDESDRSLDVAATSERRRQIREERLSEARPADPDAKRRPAVRGPATASSYDMGGCFSTVRHNGMMLHVCSQCANPYGPVEDDPKRYALVREVPLARLSEWNRYAATDKVRALEFYCPNCAVMIGSQVRKNGDPIFWDMSFGR